MNPSAKYCVQNPRTEHALTHAMLHLIQLPLAFIASFANSLTLFVATQRRIYRRILTEFPGVSVAESTVRSE
jgi:hypothetical protein